MLWWRPYKPVVHTIGYWHISKSEKQRQVQSPRAPVPLPAGGGVPTLSRWAYLLNRGTNTSYSLPLSREVVDGGGQRAL